MKIILYQLCAKNKSCYTTMNTKKIECKMCESANVVISTTQSFIKRHCPIIRPRLKILSLAHELKLLWSTSQLLCMLASLEQY